jgi:hypothetical protein
MSASRIKFHILTLALLRGGRQTGKEFGAVKPTAVAALVEHAEAEAPIAMARQSPVPGEAPGRGPVGRRPRQRRRPTGSDDRGAPALVPGTHRNGTHSGAAKLLRPAAQRRRHGPKQRMGLRHPRADHAPPLVPAPAARGRSTTPAADGGADLAEPGFEPWGGTLAQWESTDFGSRGDGDDDNWLIACSH